MKPYLFILSAALSLCLGWHLYNPMERNQPRSSTMATAAKLIALEEAIKLYTLTTKSLPVRLDNLCEMGLIARETILDDWGREFFFSVQNGNKLEIWSCGPDSHSYPLGHGNVCVINFRISKTIVIEDCDEK